MENNIQQFSIHPTSEIQRQFWVVNKLHPKTSAHNIASVFRIKGNLCIDILEETVNEIVCRHNVFRTTFSIQNGELKQKIATKSRINVFVTDINESKLIKENDGTLHLIKKEIKKPFNLSEGPLIRVNVIKQKANEYILMIIMHHIITDLRTKDLFASELSAIYNSYSARKEILLTAPEKQYTDYASKHSEWIKGAECASKLSYWETQLKGQSEMLNFPHDCNRPKIQSLNGCSYQFHLSKSHTNSLKSFSKKHNVNIFLTLLSVYIVLLHRYSRQSNFTIGVPLTNRRGEAMDKIMGCFVSILPLAVDVSDDPSFLNIQKRIRLTLLGNHRNQEVPFNTIVNKVQPIRDTAYNPIFQVGFSFEHPMKLELNGLIAESVPVHNGGSQLDMFPVLWESDEGIRGHIEYNSDLLKDSTIEQFVVNFKELLRAVEETPDQSISQLSILSKLEKEKIEYNWNNTSKEYSITGGIHTLFEKQVYLTPEAVAVVYDDVSLTFDELNRKANCLAHYLTTKKVNSGTPVGLLMHRSLELVIAVFGIIKAGGSFVPLDPDYPDDRIFYMIEDVQMPVILSHKNLVNRISNKKVDIVDLNSEWNDIESCSSINLKKSVKTSDPIYIMYTSGSTGRPKGVVNTHEGICNRILWMQDYFAIKNQDVVLQKTPYSFDVSVWEIFWPLIFGSKLIIAPPSSHKDPAEIIRLINQNHVTTIHFVPSMLRVFLENPNCTSCISLRTVICSGETLPGDLRDIFFSRLNAQLYNLYGPTEAAIDVTSWKCTKNDRTATVPIGKPISNTKIHILDHLMQSVPIGIPGEIYIGGVQLATGYCNQQELTKEKFVRDPFNGANGAKLYKTGDLAKYLPDGNIEYLGRTDFQVKIRGLRIELGEIETTICEHSGVSFATVVSKEFNLDDHRIIAYIVPDKENDFLNKQAQLIDDVKRLLSNKLPDYMIPSLFMVLEELPITQSGKIDRRSLPEPDMKRSVYMHEFIAPQNETEKMLASIWSDLLKINRVGIHDNFFDSGGSSLLAAYLASMIQIRSNLEIPVVKLFQYPTIHSFAEYLNQDNTKNLSFEQVKSRAELQKKAISRRRKKRNFEVDRKNKNSHISKNF